MTRHDTRDLPKPHFSILTLRLN